MIWLLFFAMTSARAATMITSYECTIRVLAKDLLPSGAAEITVTRPYQSPQSHGGTPYEWSIGAHKIGIVADAKWRGIIWQREGEDVAQVLTAGTEPITGNSVMILSNPKDLEEAVQLVCDPKPGNFPNE